MYIGSFECADSLFACSPAGKGDEVAALVAKVRAAAESADEPATVTYRTTRSEENSDHFLIFEEYNLPNGIVDHGKPPMWSVPELSAAELTLACEHPSVRSPGRDLPGARQGRPARQARGELLQRVQVIQHGPGVLYKGVWSRGVIGSLQSIGPPSRLFPSAPCLYGPNNEGQKEASERGHKDTRKANRRRSELRRMPSHSPTSYARHACAAAQTTGSRPTGTLLMRAFWRPDSR